MRKTTKLSLVALLFFAFTTLATAKVLAAAPTVTSFTPGASSLGRYTKYESTFQISQTYPAGSFLPYYFYDPTDNPTTYPGKNSPYGVDGITINAVFTSPSGKTLTLPAFYYQDYTRSQAGNGDEVMSTSNTYVWKVRFAPEEVGNYSYYISITTKDGTSRYPATGSLTFASAESGLAGFVKQSPRDSRFFEFENGTTYLPIGSGHQWWLCCGKRSYDYDTAFSTFNKSGINLTRIWTQNDGYGLTVEGPYDAYTYPDSYNPTGRGINIATLPKGTQINQRGAAELDAIVQSAEKNGVYMEVSSHGDVYWLWDSSVITDSYNTNPTTFSDPLHVKYWERNFRYRVARWGYSTSVLDWETWNEHGNITANSDVYNFYQTYGNYQSQTDPFRHLRTTSQGSQAWSPAFWASLSQDSTNYHDYMMSSRYPAGLWNDEVNFVYRGGQCLRMTNPTSTSNCYMGDGSSWSGSLKPLIWGELDTGSTDWNIANNSERADHNVIWAGLFSPLGGTGINWYWDSKSYLTNVFTYESIASKFFSGIDYISKKFTYLSTPDVSVTSTALSTDNSKLRALALRSSSNSEAYVWAQNKDYTWGNSKDLTPLPSAISGNVSLPGMAPGTYQITYWNTYNGTTTSGGTLTLVSGSLNIPVNNLSNDLAIKVLSTSVVNATPTPTPTIAAGGGINPSSTPTPTQVPATATLTLTPAPTLIPVGSGDTNNDGKVDITDVVNLIKNWTATTLTGMDQYLDAKINSFDFAVVRNAVLASLTPTQNSSSPTVTQAPITAAATPTTGVNISTSPSEWTQFGHDPQHSHYTSQVVASPWKLAWTWNGPDANGHVQSNHLSVPDLVQPITGGGNVYMIGNDTLFALSQGAGTTVWSTGTIGSLQATPAYSGGFIYIPSGNNNVYKIDATTGKTISTFTSTSPCTLSPTLVNTTLYVACNDGTLYALNTSNMQKLWSYQGGAASSTPPAFSSKYNLVVYGTQNLIVHALNATDGSLKWKTNPWNLSTPPRHYESGDHFDSAGAQFERGWPVIAEQHGVVFVKLNLDASSLGSGPATSHAYPSGTVATQNFLAANPSLQTIFALNLTNGSNAFVPANGAGTHTDSGARMGPQPVVAIMNGQEVVYEFWRTVDSCSYTPAPGFTGTMSWCGDMWDSAMGEMVLDNTTVPGYSAGQYRFVNYQIWDNQIGPSFPSDELETLSMSGNTIFHSHWLVSFAKTVTDRGNSLGGSFTNPIKTTYTSVTGWSEGSPNSYNLLCNFSSSHYCANGVVTYGGGNADFVRSYPAGFYGYYNDWCTLNNSCGNLNNSGTNDTFTVVSNNLVMIKGSDGEMIVLTTGSPTASANTQTEVLGTSTSVNSTALIPLSDVHKYLNQTISVEGKVTSVKDHPYTAYYFVLTDSTGNLQFRIYYKDFGKFNYSPKNLVGKQVKITGLVSLYGTQGVQSEIIVTDPSQITIE